MDKLSKALDDVLTMAHLPSKKKAALEWCYEQGVEQTEQTLIDILEAEQTNDFINALKVKEIVESTLRVQWTFNFKSWMFNLVLNG